MKEVLQKYHHKSPFETESGYRFKELEIAYQCWGTLNSDRSNVVLIFHALTGNTAADDWFSGFFTNESWIDFDNQFVICANVLGSCYGTTGPLSTNPETGKPYSGDFPEVSIRDMVRVQQLLLDHLNITGVETVIGGSMGGMLGLEFCCMDDRAESAILIGMGKAHSPWAIGISHAQRQAIAADPKWNNGYYHPEEQPENGLATARMMAMISYRCPENYEDKFGRSVQDGSDPKVFEVESYLTYQGQKLVDRFDANTYVRLSRAMDLHDMARGRGNMRKVLDEISIPVLMVGIDTDVLYPPKEQKELAKLLPNGSYRELRSRYGHDAFLLEFDVLNEIITSFYKQTQKDQTVTTD